MVGERDPKFYSELKQMNDDFVSFLKTTHEKSPYFDFTPTINDYVRQIGELTKQYPEKTVQVQAQPQAPLSFFSFAANPLAPNTTSAQPETTTTIGGGGGEEEDAEDDAPPPEPKVDKYEEPDSKYSIKCKLYEKGKSATQGEVAVNLLGIGMLYVKALDTSNKLQVIVRQDPDLRRVLLNEVVTPSIPVKLLPKAVQMLFPGPTGETKFYIAKLKDETDAQTLHDLLNFTKQL